MDLHPRCLKLKHSISDKEGHVTLNLCPTIPRKCQKCKSKKVENIMKVKSKAGLMYLQMAIIVIIFPVSRN